MITNEKEAIQIANKAEHSSCVISLNVMSQCYDIKFDDEPGKIYSLPEYLMMGYLRFWDKIWNDNPSKFETK